MSVDVQTLGYSIKQKFIRPGFVQFKENGVSELTWLNFKLGNELRRVR